MALPQDPSTDSPRCRRTGEAHGKPLLMNTVGSVVRTRARAPFWLAIYEPKRDTVISRMIENFKLWDVHVLSVLEDAVGPRCEHGGLAVDVGTNIGFFSNALLAMGCRVAGFEMQSDVAALVELSAKLNGAGDRLRMNVGAVSDKSADTLMRSASPDNVGMAFVVSEHAKAEARPCTF